MIAYSKDVSSLQWSTRARLQQGQTHVSEYETQCVKMTSSNGNIFCVTGPLWGGSTGEFPSQNQWRGALLFSLICTWTNGWVNTRDASNLRRHWAHYDVTVMDSLNADPVYMWDAHLVNSVSEDDLVLTSYIAMFSTKSPISCWWFQIVRVNQMTSLKITDEFSWYLAAFLLR